MLRRSDYECTYRNVIPYNRLRTCMYGLLHVSTSGHCNHITIRLKRNYQNRDRAKTRFRKAENLIKVLVILQFSGSVFRLALMTKLYTLMTDLGSIF